VLAKNAVDDQSAAGRNVTLARRNPLPLDGDPLSLRLMVGQHGGQRPEIWRSGPAAVLRYRRFFQPRNR
jgi:hypothetical protein